MSKDKGAEHGRGEGVDDRPAPDQSAPGKPGSPPRWATAAKTGVGTALVPGISATSLVWFTLGRGILTEVFYPRLDRASVRTLGFLVAGADGTRPVADEQDSSAFVHEVAWLDDGVPAFRLTNTAGDRAFRVEKTVLANPHQDALVQLTRFVPLKGGLGDYRLYAVIEPHLGNQGAGNTAWVGDHRGVPMLLAERGGVALALACSAPWRARSAGYVGASDGRTQLVIHQKLTDCYDRADDGNVALTGEVDLAACGGEFVLALGFGPDTHEAAHRALATLQADPGALLDDYARAWRDWLGGLEVAPPPEPAAGRDLFRTSAAVIRVHDAEAVPGAVIASLSTPWGENRGDETPEGTGGYHLVWPRDLAKSGGGLLGAGARAEAVRVLDYLRATQEPDGHWPQNMWVNSARYWDGTQLGETAEPVLLADHLRRLGALDGRDPARVWGWVRKAAGYLVRSGPSTQQDRWENQRGYTPFTLAAVVAALLAAADLADACGEPDVGRFLRETADCWAGCVESWLYVKDTALAHRLGVEGYYVRSVPPEADQISSPRDGRVRLKTVPTHKGIPITEVVSPDALALVRFGLRAADDPRVVNTVKAVDATLKAETPRGPAWRRYNTDGYGEYADGSPYIYGAKTRGIGRAWPLLTAERAHYELAAGRRGEAVRLLHAVEALANEAGLIPEQVWDADDLPDRGLYRGRPTGSAMPLVWAHAEYLKLRRSLADGRVFDLPPQAARRYAEGKVGPPHVPWRPDHRRAVVVPGETLRVELPWPATVRWSSTAGGGGGAEPARHETTTRDSGLGLFYADLPTDRLRAGDKLEVDVVPAGPDVGRPDRFTVRAEGG